MDFLCHLQTNKALKKLYNSNIEDNKNKNTINLAKKLQLNVPKLDKTAIKIILPDIHFQ